MKDKSISEFKMKLTMMNSMEQKNKVLEAELKKVREKMVEDMKRYKLEMEPIKKDATRAKVLDSKVV